jgi:Trypsin
MHRLALIVVVFFMCNPACAMVGETESLAGFRSRPEAMILGTGKNLCSAVAIAPSLLLTAAHCIMPGDIYKRVELDAEGRPIFKPSAAVMQHPQFDIKSYLAHRVTADVGLVKLKEPMAALPVPLAGPRQRIAPPKASWCTATVGRCAMTATRRRRFARRA